MTFHNWILTALEALFWYGFLSYGMYAIKHQINPWVSGFILLVFLYGAVISSPFVRQTDAWKKMLQN